MSTQFTINAESRSDLGKGASRRLRRTNQIPAVIYGGGDDPLSLTINHDDVIKSLENEAFYSSILDINIAGKTQKAVLKDVQRHAFKPKVLHLDFQRVNEKEKIHMHVPLHFRGEDIAPGVKAGGMVAHQLSELEITCLAKDLPEYILVDVSAMDIGDTIHISDLSLSTGVESVALAHGADHDLPVAIIQKLRGGDEEDAADDSVTEDDAGSDSSEES